MNTLLNSITYKQKKEIYHNFIAGEWVPPKSLRYLPANFAAAHGALPHSCGADINNALDSAKQVAAQWGQITTAERCFLLSAISEKLLTEIQDSARDEPHSSEKTELRLSKTLQHYCRQIHEPPILISQFNGAFRQLQPGTVIKQMTPVCIHLAAYLERTFASLVAGHCLVNCVLLHPDYRMPIPLLRFIEIAGKILPKGVLNVIFGLAAEAGSTLICSNKAITAAQITSPSPYRPKIVRHNLH